MNGPEGWREERDTGEQPTMAVWVSPELGQPMPRVGGWRQVVVPELVSNLTVGTGGYGLIIEPMKKTGWADMTVRLETTHLTEGGAVYTFGQGTRWAADQLVIREGAKGGMRGIQIQTGEEPSKGTPSELWPIYADIKWQKGTSSVARIGVTQRQIYPTTEWLMAAGMGGWREVMRTEREMMKWEEKMQRQRANIERALQKSTTDVAQWLISMAETNQRRRTLVQIFGWVNEGPAFNQRTIRMANDLLTEGKMMAAFSNQSYAWAANYLEDVGWKVGERLIFDTKVAVAELPAGLNQIPLDVDFYKKIEGIARWTGGIRADGGWRQLAIGQDMGTYGL